MTTSRASSWILLLLAAWTTRAGEPAPAGAPATPAAVSPQQLADAVEEAHAVLWSKFIGDDGFIHDFVGELPTPEDCEQGRPNAIGWWSPIENGPMFTGTYLVAICERARRSGASADREEARRLARGLLACASVSDVPGFIARMTTSRSRTSIAPCCGSMSVPRAPWLGWPTGRRTETCAPAFAPGSPSMRGEPWR